MFWIVQNGIKMTGSRTFGEDHADEAILEITAFVKQLPAMTPERYQALTGAGRHGHGGNGNGDDVGGQEAGAHKPARTE